MPPNNVTGESVRYPQLPALEPGLTLLTVDTDVRHAIHALAVDHILTSTGDACWIDPGTHAQTDPLVDLAPSRHILTRIHVARGFTPFQHLDLLRSLPGLCSPTTELVVVPLFDRYYRDETLLADEGREMLLSGLASLVSVGRNHEIPVLVTRASTDEFSEPIVTAATNTITCEATQFGPRFRGAKTETLVYPTAGQWVQTTLGYWAEILADRQARRDHQTPTPQEV